MDKKHKISIKLSARRWYIPDFLIEYSNGIKTLEEVKGYVRDKLHFEKQIAAAKQYCEENKLQFEINYMLHLKNIKSGKSKNNS